ncbi:HD domain-containing protein [Pedobacter petrophilus]|uniref:HD domain-containing protein n=1 Tax=Pedobacter petrophilus TaxID=1908241 RepID=A0A7K0G0Y6_9SPHI|nr:bifunctional (p)ppGpp synthetase/guanosine-3',5'-bis(diphosphate) 3'-pyrophosphohydrolase [Pedobacter petrophilus]MRX77090.1 HD domain-containing protein [Pedobacter petrophilus]
MNYNEQLKEVRSFAIKAHDGQKYGAFPYEVHLMSVLSTLLKFNIFPTNEEHYKILAGAWLHDVLEDTDISKNEFINHFGEAIFDIVWSVTDGEGEDRKARKNIMYSRLIHNQQAIIVKLADRIANVEASIILGNEAKLAMYQSEMEQLSAVLANKITTKVGNMLFGYLKLLTDYY